MTIGAKLDGKLHSTSDTPQVHQLSTTPLRQLSIHPSKEIITTWLEE